MRDSLNIAGNLSRSALAAASSAALASGAAPPPEAGMSTSSIGCACSRENSEPGKPGTGRSVAWGAAAQPRGVARARQAAEGGAKGA